MNNWYKKLKTAPWSPPPYVFGIVWPILYIFLQKHINIQIHIQQIGRVKNIRKGG